MNATVELTLTDIRNGHMKTVTILEGDFIAESVALCQFAKAQKCSLTSVTCYYDQPITVKPIRDMESELCDVI